MQVEEYRSACFVGEMRQNCCLFLARTTEVGVAGRRHWVHQVLTFHRITLLTVADDQTETEHRRRRDGFATI